jgi:hypothetical protein
MTFSINVFARGLLPTDLWPAEKTFDVPTIADSIGDITRLAIKLQSGHIALVGDH